MEKNTINWSEVLKKTWETRRKLGKTEPWNKKPIPPKEELEKMYIVERKSTRDIGKYYDIAQHCIREWMISYGIPRRTYRENPNPVPKGSTMSEKHRKAISAGSIGKPPTQYGKNHWNWRGGITPINAEIRNSKEYKEWRSAVFKRDKFQCVNPTCESGKRIEADHIKPFSKFPKLRFEVSNGRTLCQKCHKNIGWQFFKDENPKQHNKH